MNIIELVEKYLPVLDEQYRVQAKTAVLDTPAEFVQMTKEAKKVKIAKMTTDKLAEYGRNGGFVKGKVELNWQEHTFRYDRGRALQVDAMDNIETLGLAFGRLSGTFQRDATIPELDALRFSEYFKNAGIKKEVVLTKANVLATIDDIVEEQDDAEVPEGGKILFVSPKAYKLMMNDENIVKNFNVHENLTKALNKKIYEYNDMPIIKVPSTRFFQEITLLDGTTVGEEVGGYEGNGTIDLLIVSTSAILQISKRAIARIWAPTRAEAAASQVDGVNPDADAWKFDFRVYHDAWVLENKTKGIAAVVPPTVDLTITAGAGGTAVPVGAQEVEYGKDFTILITPATGKAIDSVLVNSVEKASTVVEGVLKLTNVIAATTVAITFEDAA